MAKFTIGGEAIEVSLPNFKAMKAVWPRIEAATAAPGFVPATEAVLELVSARGTPQHSVDDLEERLTPAEARELATGLNELLIEMGLAKPKGEAPPAGKVASPSPETSTPSSPASSSASDQPTGTA